MPEVERHVDVEGLPDSRRWGYAQVVVAGDFVFVAGQAGQDESGAVVSTEFGPQARRTFENIERALAVADCELGDIVAMTAFITDWRFAPELVAVRKEVLGDHLATDALIGVSQLADPEMLLEVQCTAVKPVR